MNQITTENNRVELTVSPELEKGFKDFMEIEMLQGTRQVLPNGQLYFDMQMPDDKIEILRQVLLEYSFKFTEIEGN